MFFVIKRKKLTVGILIVFLLLSAYISFKTINFKTTDKSAATSSDNVDDLQPGDVIAVSGNNNYFTKAKNEKELTRSKTTELLKNIINNEFSDEQAVADAENAIISIAYNMDMEQKIELLLAAKGFNESVVYISDELTTVTLKTNSLSNEDAAKINDIVTGITGNNNVKIVEVK